MGLGGKIVLVLKILALSWQRYSSENLCSNQQEMCEWSFRTEVSAGFGSHVLVGSEYHGMNTST